MHALLNLRGNIPDFIVISDGKTHDANILDLMLFESGAFYVMDRGYLDFKRLYVLHKRLAFFVTREKTNIAFTVCESRPVNKETGLRCDQTIRLSSATSRKHYPERLRRVKYHDPDTGNILTFYTNDFDLLTDLLADKLPEHVANRLNPQTSHSAWQYFSLHFLMGLPYAWNRAYRHYGRPLFMVSTTHGTPPHRVRGTRRQRMH